MKLIINSLSGIILILLNCKAHATELEIAANFLRFDYKEFSTANFMLDRETGWLPGLSVIVNDNLYKKLGYELEFTNHEGNVDYNGRTQSGLPHTTTTDENIKHLGLRLFLPFSQQTNNTRIYGGTRRYHWERDIRDNNGVFGLYEVYKWWEISAGFQSNLWSNINQQITYDIALLYINTPTIMVDLNRLGRGSTKLNIGEKFGTRIQIAWEKMTNQQWSLKVNSYLEYWEFGRSNTRLTSGGLATAVTEPRSETVNIGLQFSLKRSF